MCQHPDAGQILITTDAPHFLTYHSLRKGSQGAKTLEWIINALKFIMMLAGIGMCDESFWITADLLKLIVDCIADCQLSSLLFIKWRREKEREEDEEM